MKHATILAMLVFALAGAPAWSQQIGPRFVALGDSIGEGVQSADASFRTQPFDLWNLVAQQLGVSFPLPLIQSGALSNIFSTKGRSRIHPQVPTLNVSVSGATIHEVLNDRFQPPVDTETDLVLMPRTGSQMEIAESLKAPLNMIWIGNNDVDGAVLRQRIQQFNQIITQDAQQAGMGVVDVYGSYPVVLD